LALSLRACRPVPHILLAKQSILRESWDIDNKPILGILSYYCLSKDCAVTPNLNLPLIAAGQAQKHVTMNDALVALDTLAQLAVINRTQVAPPVTPAEGAAYIVAANATGAFSGHHDKVAVYDVGGWRFYAPSNGWRCYNQEEQALLVWSGTAWQNAGLPVSPSQLGINTTADATNRLAVKSPATLLDNIGAGHQLKINKAAVANSASLLMQTGYSGRAEIGLTGDDKLRFKVSANGTSWKDAMIVDQSTGLATVFGPPTTANGIATKAYADSISAQSTLAFDYQLASNLLVPAASAWAQVTGLTSAQVASPHFNTAQSRFIAPAAGVYVFMANLVHTAGATPTTITIAALKNGVALGNWINHRVDAGLQGNTLFYTMLQLAQNDAVGLGIWAQAATTINFGFTSFSGYRV
jgi:Protein of unknown function (DUF2793)